MEKKYCPRCGAENSYNANVCTHCGYVFQRSDEVLLLKEISDKMRNLEVGMAIVCIILILVLLGSICITIDAMI